MEHEVNMNVRGTKRELVYTVDLYIKNTDFEKINLPDFDFSVTLTLEFDEVVEEGEVSGETTLIYIEFQTPDGTIPLGDDESTYFEDIMVAIYKYIGEKHLNQSRNIIVDNVIMEAFNTVFEDNDIPFEF